MQPQDHQLHLYKFRLCWLLRSKSNIGVGHEATSLYYYPNFYLKRYIFLAWELKDYKTNIIAIVWYQVIRVVHVFQVWSVINSKY